VVGVVSATAGIGRTTVAALLASVLAATRQGLTVAVDAHPGPGSLTDRLPLDLDVPAGELLGLLDHPALSGGELLACLAVRGPAVVASAGRRRRAGGSGRCWSTGWPGMRTRWCWTAAPALATRAPAPPSPPPTSSCS
jgi:hypothetical protein